MASTLIDNEKAANSGQEQELQIVVMELGDELYGIDIAHIHTIILPQAITHVPKAPKYVRGVLNLRGRIIPVVDLRDRFGLSTLSEDESKRARIVIVDVQGLTAGLIVDAVSEVLRLSNTDIDPPSQLVTSAESECIIGIGRIREGGEGAAKAAARLVILLDIHKTLTTSPQDTVRIKKLQKAA